MSEPIATAAAAAAARAANRAIDNIAQKLGKSLGSATGHVFDQVMYSLRVGFREYLEASYNKCRHFKTILNPSQPLEVKAHYVHVTLRCGEKEVSDDDLIDGIEALQSIVVTGLAGSGKSMLMKYLTVWYFENTREITPLFLELRQLNALTNKDILTYIRNSCVSKTAIISEGQFQISLRSGAFLIILDGFDELNLDIRDQIQDQIFKIRRDYPAANVIVSSCPDDRFSGWPSFHVYGVNAFTTDQVTTLITSLPYDSGVKRRFLKELSTTLFQKHGSFLSTPLLATMMLLTFEGNAGIPSKMHEFYAQAFDTLFTKHDAMKEQYRRETRTKLALEDFKVCFSAFCAISYLNGDVSFLPDQLRQTAAAALDYFAHTKQKVRSKKDAAISATDLITDLRDAVCMLQPDGIAMSFVHRSFQEYFAAKFVTLLSGSKIRRIIDQYCRRPQDAVVTMAYEMYREPVEQEWVLPTLNSIESDLQLGAKPIDSAEGARKLISALNIISFGSRISTGFAATDLFLQLNALVLLYPDQLQDVLSSFFFSNTHSEGFRKKILSYPQGNSPRLKAFKTFFAEAKRAERKQDPIGAPTVMAIRPIGDGDGWWLDALGMGQVLDHLSTAISGLKSEIAARESHRASILQDFI